MYNQLPNRRRTGYLSFLLAFAALCAGCADLKGINKFSANAGSVVATPLPYWYSDYSYDSCYTFPGASCDTTIPRLNDTTIAHEAGKLNAYFTALTKLSGSAEIIDVDTVAGAVTAGTYGKLSVTSTEASIFSGAATAAQDLFTAGFKSKHLTENLHRYGYYIDSAIGSYAKHVEVLAGYSGDLFEYLRTKWIIYKATGDPRDPTQWSVLYAYSSKLKELRDIHGQFEKLKKQLVLVREGYRDLLVSADKPKSKALKQRLFALVNNITFLSNGTKN